MDAERQAAQTPEPARQGPAPDGPDSPGSRTVVEITDPQAIRALAHKVRLEVIEELFNSRHAFTATALAGRFGLSPSAMSYHLRALEKWGYVVRAESGGDGRERYWRAAGETLRMGGTAMAAELVNSSFIDLTLSTARERVVRALQNPAVTEGAQRPVFLFETGKYLLTREQAQGFADDFDALCAKYEQLSHEAGREDPGVRNSYMTMMFVPEVDGPESVDGPVVDGEAGR